MALHVSQRMHEFIIAAVGIGSVALLDAALGTSDKPIHLPRENTQTAQITQSTPPCTKQSGLALIR